MHERQRYANRDALNDNSYGTWNMLTQTASYTTIRKRVGHPCASMHRSAVPLARMSMSRYARHLES
jgi:hypothetical protein